MSRPSLREALSALQFAGYVESRQGYGTVVVSHNGSSPKRRSHSQPSDPVDLLEARLLIEPLAARLAALNPDPRMLKGARAMLEAMWLAVDAAGSLGIDTDVALHAAIARMCQNSHVRDAALSLLELANPPTWRNSRSRLWSDSATVQIGAIEHEATLSAIRARQPDRAERCARHHLLATIGRHIAHGGLLSKDRARLEGVLARNEARLGKNSEPQESSRRLKA